VPDPTAGEPRWLDDEEQQAWRRLISGVTVLERELEHRLQAAHDLSLDDYAILVLLSESPGRRLRMSQLADQTIIARPHLTYRVGRLEERGIVQRRPCEGDARGVEAHLTDAGFEVLHAAACDHVRSVRECVVDVLSRDEFLALGRTMGRIHGAVTGEEVADPRRA
jgi:DNA-binding MarR family transcriptional regulator